MEIRLQKVIADAGVASRRKAEELIRQGRVTVNGRVSTEMGLKVDPARDHVKVDGRHLKPAAPKAYVMLNKPGGVLTTLEGPGVEGRFTVQQFLRGVRQRVFPVGRLRTGGDRFVADAEIHRLRAVAVGSGKRPLPAPPPSRGRVRVGRRLAS